MNGSILQFKAGGRFEDAEGLNRLGLMAVRAGELDKAFDLLSSSVQLDGGNIASLSDLAGVLKAMGRFEESIEFYRAAVAVAPRDARLHTNLGAALVSAGALKEAEQCHRRAVKLDPQLAIAHSNLGAVYQARGEIAPAIASYRRARRLSPEMEAAMANLGGCLCAAGQFEEAIEVLSRGIQKHPHSATAFSNLAAAYNGVNRFQEATDSAFAALRINPRYPDALINLGNALKARGEYAEAVNCFTKASQLEPSNHLAHNNLGSTLSEMGRSPEALSALRRALELMPDSAASFSNFLLTLNYLPDIPRETLLAEHLRFEERFAQPLTRQAPPFKNRREPQRRLRVGYVSADLRDHPVANFIEPILSTHSPLAFEVFCYENHTVGDAVTARLRGYVPHWENVAALTDEELAAQIRRDRIDILVDLSGHTAGNRLLTFARRAAPIQVTMIGYMQTTGMRAMDYRITDENIDPPGASDAFSTEKLVRMAHGAAPFRPPSDCPPVNDLPALRNGYVTFASFNNLAKITPEALNVWANILRALPTSKLMLVGRSGNTMTKEFAARGIPPDQLQILNRVPMRAYLELHHRVDVLFDTFPYNGGTTSLLAAWMGVPMISLAGADPASRTGSSLLAALGCPELIAQDSDDYARRAVAAAGDLSLLAGWRAMLRGRLAGLLGNGAGFTTELETVFREMWRNYCATSA